MVSTIFRKMADIYNCQVGFWQRQFLGELFKAVFSLRGRVNFTNLARFSPLHEQTFRRHFRKAFRWVWLNLTVFRLRRHPEEPIIGVFDCSFLPKSGTETWGPRPVLLVVGGQVEAGFVDKRFSDSLPLKAVGLSASAPRKRLPISQQTRRTDTPAWTSTSNKLSICMTNLPI